MTDEFKATLKKDLFVSIISGGSIVQKERCIETAQKAYEWCTLDVGQAQAAPTTKNKKADK